MEDQIISVLNSNPGIKAGQLLREFPKGTRRDTIYAVSFDVFRRISLDEQLMPAGMGFDELALLLDQLMEAAKNRSRGALGRQRKEAGHV